MAEDDRGLRICALCRHLQMVEQGREFEGIADTEYAIFHCRLLGWTVREDYLMAPPTRNLDAMEPFDCPYFQAWELPCPRSRQP